MRDEIAFNDDTLHIRLRPPVSTEQMLENMRSAIARGLREIKPCRPHDGTFSVAAGGPSLADTYMELEGHVAAANGSLRFLLERGIVPHFCGVMDATERMVDIVEADPNVYYLVASNCHPALFDKLIRAGCDVRLWHPTPDNVGATPDQFVPREGGGFTLLGENHPSRFMIGGGSCIGLRLIQIGYVLGYRRFQSHGNDASFRGTETHAYADRRSGEWVDHSSIEINGYRTSLNFIHHVTSFANMLEKFQQPPFEPVEIEMFGDGLMQTCYRYWQANKDEMSPVEAFQRADSSYRWPNGDREGWRIEAQCRRNISVILEHTVGRSLAVQAGGNVGILPQLLAPHFDEVVTFEPDPENFNCLDQNVTASNVVKRCAALGESPSYISLQRDALNCGAHFVNGVGTIPVMRIDDLGLDACNLIALDVEGYELAALKGAQRTIAAFRPTIVIEENGLSERYGVPAGATTQWLVDNFSYVIVGGTGRDVVLKRC